MATTSAIPDERTIQPVLKKLKAYNAYKAKQMQAAGEGPPPAQEGLQTVETWANDAEDTGEAWAEQRGQEAQERIAEAEHWKRQVRRDEELAAREAELRAQMDMQQVKAELTKQLEDYQNAVRQQAKDGQAWAKRQSVQVMQETKEAREFVEGGGLEKAMDLSAQKGAEQRRKRRLIAEKMEQRAAGARQWQSEYADQPGKWPAGQRQDVVKALDAVSQWAQQKSADLETLGGSAAPHVAALRKVQDWCGGLKSQVNAQGAALGRAKQDAVRGVAETQVMLTNIEAYENSLESEANENLEQFRRWTDRNNALAKEWVKSENPKLKQWAEEWMKTQEQ